MGLPMGEGVVRRAFGEGVIDDGDFQREVGSPANVCALCVVAEEPCIGGERCHWGEGGLKGCGGVTAAIVVGETGPLVVTPATSCERGWDEPFHGYRGPPADGDTVTLGGDVPSRGGATNGPDLGSTGAAIVEWTP